MSRKRNTHWRLYQKNLPLVDCTNETKNENFAYLDEWSCCLPQRLDPTVSYSRRRLEGQHRHLQPGRWDGQEIPHCAHEVSLKLAHFPKNICLCTKNIYLYRFLRESMLKKGRLENEELKLQLFYDRELGSSLYKFFCEEKKAGTVSPFFRCPNLEKSILKWLVQLVYFLGNQSRIEFPCVASSRNLGTIDAVQWWDMGTMRSGLKSGLST